MTIEMMEKLNNLLNNPYVMSVYSQYRSMQVCKVCAMPVCGRRCDRRMIVEQLEKEIEDVRKGSKSRSVQESGAVPAAKQEAVPGGASA